MSSTNTGEQPRSRFAASGASIGHAVGFRPELTSEAAGWNNLALFSWQGRCSEARFRSFPETMIIYHAGGAPSIAVRVGARIIHHTHPGMVTIIPPATPVRWEIDGEVNSRSLHLTSRFFEDGDRTTPAAAELPFRCGVDDPLITAVIATLERELRAPSQAGGLYADSVADTLALHLLATRGDPAVPAAAVHGTLPPRLLRRAVEQLEEGIEDGVSLQDLADAARLSRSHFANAFRRATGLPPHRYLTRLRLERARELLRGSELAIAEIALRCGFSSQAHLTTSFRAAYATSPRQYRLQS